MQPRMTQETPSESDVFGRGLVESLLRLAATTAKRREPLSLVYVACQGCASPVAMLDAVHLDEGGAVVCPACGC